MAKMRGPDGTWYGLQVYYGCRDCGTGLAFDIVRLNEFFDQEELDHIQTLDAHETGYGSLLVPLLQPEDMVAPLRQVSSDQYLDADDIRWAMEQAVGATRKKHPLGAYEMDGEAQQEAQPDGD